MSAPAELPESQATGAIADIFAELRRLTGVPYVSSIFRHLATMPGMLEWAWAALGPAFRAGAIQQAGAALAADAALPAAPPPTPEMLAQWGLDAPALRALHAACAGFVRVAPGNLVAGACLSRRLAGAPAAGPGFATGWTPPASLPPVPPTPDPAALPAPTRALLDRLATADGAVRFVPGLYRQLAHWPGLLAWVADALPPRLAAPAAQAAMAAMRAAAATAAAPILAALPAAPPAPLDAPGQAAVRAAVARYGRTSPELTLAGRFLAAALPASG